MGYNGFLKLRRGLSEHFDADKISYLEAGLYLRLLLKADFTTGVFFTTTNELVYGGDYFQVYRALQRLEKKGYIRTWRTKGEKTRYPVMINKFPREDGTVLNAFESPSWEELKWGPAKVVQTSCKGSANVVQRWEGQTIENKEDIGPQELKNLRTKEKEINIGEYEVTTAKKISVLSLQILGIDSGENDKSKESLKILAEAFGPQAVVDAFEKWAKSEDPDSIKYPLSAFLKVAAGVLRGVRLADKNTGFVCELASLSNNAVTFNNKQASELLRLAEKYSEEEVKTAFKEFYNGLDDFTLKRAAQDFVEKADQFVYTQKKRKEKLDAAYAEIARAESVTVIIPDEPEDFEL